MKGAGDVDADGNRPSRVDVGVHFDFRFGSAEVGPRKERQRQIDGCGVARLNGVLQFEAKVLSGVKGPGFAHEALWLNPPKATTTSGLTFRQVAMSLAPCQLSKGRADELLTTAERFDARLGVVNARPAEKCLAIHQIENL